MTCHTFATIPLLDLELLQSPDGRREIVAKLRDALITVGFFYLSNIDPWVPKDIRERFVHNAQAVCNMPLDKKEQIAMINSKHFLGYSRMGCERTARQFLSPLPAPGPNDPVYMNVQGPNQWPDEQTVPGFKRSLEDYLNAIEVLGNEMKVLIAEALGLPSTALHQFFPTPPRNKISLLKYPEPWTLSNGNAKAASSLYQGVGPHKDGGILTYLLQASPHRGLEAQNARGDWIGIPPIEDTVVVNVGRSLEGITRGVCTATMHRVNLKTENFLGRNGRSLGPRFSFPVFQTLKLDLQQEELQSLTLPAQVRALRPTRTKSCLQTEEFFARYHLQCPGMGIFTARLTSHPDVAQKWYPDIAAKVLQGQAEFAAMKIKELGSQ